MKHALNQDWDRLWLESNSKLVVLAFRKASIVSWKLINRWEKCIQALNRLNFLTTHIFKDENYCVDKFANLSLLVINYT